MRRFGHVQSLGRKERGGGKGNVRRDDDNPAKPLPYLAFESNHVRVIKQDDGRANRREDVPVSGKRDAFFALRPHAHDLVEPNGHEQADEGHDEIHVHHLPQRAELERVVQERAKFLHK